MTELTRLEEQILLSIWKLNKKAYGLTIYDHIRKLTERDMAISGIYFPLERLVTRKYIEAIQAEPTPERGGQSKRYYRLTKAGLEKLLKTLDIHQAFWKDLPDLDYI
jgi:DNA-binding PadR family transcriptional regulator